jgi:hypothetical protein
VSGLTPSDLRLIRLAAERDADLRAGLSTLARLGVSVRRADPDRAEALVTAFESHPFYKAGQTLFDLLEWEDFLLDGPPAALDAAAMLRLAAPWAERLGLPLPALPDLSDLPPLEAGFHLFRDVAIGLLALASMATEGLPELP